VQVELHQALQLMEKMEPLLALELLQLQTAEAKDSSLTMVEDLLPEALQELQVVQMEMAQEALPAETVEQVVELVESVDLQRLTVAALQQTPVEVAVEVEVLMVA
jgi:hypothetical protein